MMAALYTRSFTTNGTTSAAVIWRTWVSEDLDAANTTTTTDTSNGVVWKAWATGVTTSASTSNNYVWVQWNSNTEVSPQAVRTVPYVYVAPQETAEQRQARELREAERAARFRMEDEERRRKQAEALQRANDLLVTMLNAQQLKDWQEKKWFEVMAGGKRFRLHNQYSGNVDEFEGDKRVAKHCIVPTLSIPIPDQLIAQKLMLESDLNSFYRIANTTRIN